MPVIFIPNERKREDAFKDGSKVDTGNGNNMTSFHTFPLPGKQPHHLSVKNGY